MAVAGWLRRWGYRDLAWSVLQRARVRASPRSVLVAEEMRVLLDGGWPGRALERAGYPGPLKPGTGPVAGLALAVLGRSAAADEVLAAAADATGSVRELAAVDVAR
ncbi:helix-turn-helix domain-containing protein, partial [Streptomyces sp. NPDC003860]